MKNIHQSLPGSLVNSCDEDSMITRSLPRSSTPLSCNSKISSPLIRSNSLIRFTGSLSINKKSLDGDEISSDDEQSNPVEYNPNDFHLDEDLIVLIPFNHQVGGHTQLMLLNQNTLCKPLIPRELLFYLNIPNELNGFVPVYKGVVEICHNESTIPTLYHPIKNFMSNINSDNSCCREKRPELRVRLSSCNDRGLLESNQHLSEQRGYSSRPNQQYFMLLENIVYNYHLPCVLDLKMGTRQHSDDASDEKRHRQMAKCAASTSATLGVRICGMQVYHKISNNTYTMFQRDKYYGRRIKNEIGLKNELEIYFKNRTYFIRPIISRLKKLKAKIMEILRTTSLRFFSTSLLIVTEGCFDSYQNRHGLKYNYSDGEEDYDEYEDDDYYFDLEDEEFDVETAKNDDDHHHFHHHFHHHHHHHHQMMDDELSSSLDSMSDESEKSHSSDYSSNGIPYGTNHYNCKRDHRHRSSKKNNVSEFDIRLIDFAHTSFNSTSSSDYGFVLGLNNLIRLLNEILFDEIRAMIVNNPNNNKRRRSSVNIDNYNQIGINFQMPSNKKWNKQITNNKESLIETSIAANR